MQKECRIVLPFYKIVYAAAFVVILSLVRGVSAGYEIGIALEPAMAVLSVAFCADTYVLEVTSGRSEVWRLYPMKKRLRAVAEEWRCRNCFCFCFPRRATDVSSSFREGS